MLFSLNQVKKLATASLAMTSCAFALMVSQQNIHAASTDQATPVVQSSQATQPSSTNTNQQASSQVNLNDQGNYAWLDSASVHNTNGGVQP